MSFYLKLSSHAGHKMQELNCGCRKWYVVRADSIVYDNLEVSRDKDYMIDHQCSEITVYRRKQALHRIYYLKIKNEEPTNTDEDEDDTDNVLR